MATDAKIHALVITGGHGFEPEPFWEMFNSFDNFSYDTVVFPDAFQYLNVEAAKNYDALVFLRYVAGDYRRSAGGIP